MLQNTITIEQRHQKFVTKSCETRVVFGLKSTKGFATTLSNDYEDENGDPIEMICFWSEEALARACIIEEWKDYTVESIPLTAFIENWCVGMHNDGLLVGTNFDRNLFGFEIEPLELTMELIQEIKKYDYDLRFIKFKDLNDIELQTRKILEE